LPSHSPQPGNFDVRPLRTPTPPAMRYQVFLEVLDRIRLEAPSAIRSKYVPTTADPESLGQARSKAFIHLYLKVMFGVTDFMQRERTIADSSGDGGIDAYYIDTDTKTIHLIQSKFRVTERNFQEKQILLEELLKMDLLRILDGEITNDNGTKYNGKILQLQREVSTLKDVARYTYLVVVLANLKDVPPNKVRQLMGGFPCEIFNFERTYRELVFPVITGTYFKASDITIPIDLSNKNAGSKISYNVKTKFSDCEITVLFVPTIEVAKVMHKYKNAILRYNPRSYLDLEGQSVNTAIRNTILQTDTNEFALFNNGITMLSEETNINEKIGQKNKAQLMIKNPQIINGGQTSFTLSRIYNDDVANAEKNFGDKEVLLKIITLIDNSSDSQKLALIDEISNATNKQTPVFNADRFANETFHEEIQRKVFDRYGLLYERKRGEYSDGIKDGYVKARDVIERNHFWRLYYTANGKINRGFQKRLFQRNDYSDANVMDDSTLDRLFLAVHVFKRLKTDLRTNERIEKDTYGKVYGYIEMFLPQGLNIDPNRIDDNIILLEQKWQQFIQAKKVQTKANPGRIAYIDKVTGETKVVFNETKYYRGSTFERDLITFFASKP
jgi:hypothetical protein